MDISAVLQVTSQIQVEVTKFIHSVQKESRDKKKTQQRFIPIHFRPGILEKKAMCFIPKMIENTDQLQKIEAILISVVVAPV